MVDMGYSFAVALVACPFCREMFEKDEATACPVCNMPLVAFEKLPPSYEAATEDGVPIQPLHEKLPATYMRRGKGALALIGFIGLAMFFLPWIHVKVPDVQILSGWQLGKSLGWAYGAGVAWMVLIPTVLSRRTLAEMFGARVAAAFLCAIPGVEVLVLHTFPPRTLYYTLGFDFAWPYWVTAVLSVLGVFFALRLGGRPEDIEVRRGTSSGQIVH
jgi:hypothetical protein